MSYSFLITGGSSGFGLSLALTALRAGHKVVATARSPAKSRESYPDVEKLGGSWLALDVTKPDTASIVSEAVDKHGVNILVNSAGYAALGAVEDFSDEETLAQLDTNLFGCLRTIRGALPSFRSKKHGIIVNVSSGAGFTGRPARGIYAASKFALEGVTESLSAEVAPFGIRVILVEPGAFPGTGFVNSLVMPAKGLSKTYEGTPADDVLKLTKNLASMRLGDTEKAAQRMLEVITGTGMAESEDVQRCLRVPLGSDCMKTARQKVATWSRELDLMEAISASTDHQK